MKKTSFQLKTSLIVLTLLFITKTSYAQLAWRIDSISVSPQVATNTNTPIRVDGKMFSNTFGDCDSTLTIIGDTIFIDVNFRETCTPVNNNSWSSFANFSPLSPGKYYVKVTAEVFYPNAPFTSIRVKVDSFSVGSVSGLSNQKIFNKETSQVYLYPNPVSDSFTLRFNNPKSLPHQFVLFNSLGQVSKTIKVLNTENFRIERGNLPSGVYYYKLIQGNQIISTGKLIFN